MTSVVVFLNCACDERQFSQTCQKTGSKLFRTACASRIV